MLGSHLNYMHRGNKIGSIMVDDYAALFNCTLLGRASDSIMATT